MLTIEKVDLDAALERAEALKQEPAKPCSHPYVEIGLELLGNRISAPLPVCPIEGHVAEVAVLLSCGHDHYACNKAAGAVGFTPGVPQRCGRCNPDMHAEPASYIVVIVPL